MTGGKLVLGALIVASLQVLVTSALGGYPGTFYRIMMMLNKDRKNPRTAPSPNQLWAILDPPASLGSLGGAPLRTNRIIRSAGEFSTGEDRRQTRQEPEIEPEILKTQEALIESLINQNEPVQPFVNRNDLDEPPVNQEDPVEPSVNQEEPDETPVNQVEPDEPPVNQVEPDEVSVNQEEPTEPPMDEEDATEVPDDLEETETESPEVETEAPLLCGGDLRLSIDPLNMSIPDNRFLYEIVETPGWEEGEYPEDIECIWNLIVDEDCIMGMVVFTVLEGEIRDTVGCKGDYLRVIYDSGIANVYCGTVVVGNFKVSGTDVWTMESQVPRTTQIIFKSSSRQLFGGGGRAKGVKIEIGGYCWKFSEDLLSRTTTTTTTTTTTPAPTEIPEVESEEADEGTDEVVTEIAEDPLALDSETDEASDTNLNEEQEGKEVVDDPLLDTVNVLGIQESQLQEVPIPEQPEQLEETVPEGSVVSLEPVSDEPVSLLGSEAVGGGAPSQLLPNGPVPSAAGGPVLPVVPAAASAGGFIPIVPLRDESKDEAPSRIISRVQPIVTQLLNSQKK